MCPDPKETPKPVETPPAPPEIKALAEKAEEGTVDITQAILTAYREGRKDETEATEKTRLAEKNRASKKSCWYCGTENNCGYCNPKGTRAENQPGASP